MGKRGRIAIAVVAVLVWTGVIAGVAVLNAVTDRSVAMVGGCPSKAFPIRPDSELNQSSVITVGTTSGCWATYDQPKSATEEAVFKFYLDPANTPGWAMRESYDNSHYAAFRNVKDSEIQADVEVTTFKTFFVAGPSTIRLAISICRCDPREMAQ